MKYYWKQKDGKVIDVDDMSIDHLRNCLKMMIRDQQKPKFRRKTTFELNGDMANQFNNEQDDAEEQENYYSFLNH